MPEIGKLKGIDIIISFGKNRLFVYSAIAALSDNGVLVITQSELAKRLGVSDKFLQQIADELTEFTIKGEPVLQIDKSNRGHVYTVKLDALKKQKRTVKKKVTATHAIYSYFLEQYEARYGVPYMVTHIARERNNVKTFCSKYNDDVVLLKAIIDVVMRLYDSKWKQSNFPRPTIGQLVSWLGRQAEPFARANIEVSEVQISVEGESSDFDVLDAFDAKWGV